MTLSAAMCSKCFHHLFARAVQRLGHLSRRHWPGNCCGREPCERRDADLLGEVIVDLVVAWDARGFLDR